VYLTLVSQEAGCWSAREIAERSHLDPDETERVLEAFKAAGVVDAIDAPEGRRHRWRSDMQYLFGEEGESPEWVDPVCGMPVLAETPYVADDEYRRPRRFCSSLCLGAFLASPNTFVGPAHVGVRAAV
jgi:YHS domain-containing protein